METRILRRIIDENARLRLSDLPPLLQKIYASRQVTCKEDIDRSLRHLLPFNLLLDIDKAVSRIACAIATHQKILIIGDFDADGATSTAVAVCGLKLLGATQVDFLVPNRFTFGYGLTPGIVDLALKQKPDVIITVDNGIASIEGVSFANQHGIDVIVTDHHLQGKTLPKAYAIVNPNRQGDPFPSKAMAGVGVIFYVILALRAHLKREINLAQLLDLVALGTIADVVPLDKNNRIMVYQGLQRIKAGVARPGIQALIAIAKRDAASLKAADLGYSIGPRLNAAGRLDDMSLGIRCLLAEDEVKALQLATQLDTLNHERRVIENEMKAQAFQYLDQLHLHDKLPMGLCLYDETWHQGVVGLVASRVKDKINRPVIAFAESDHECIKGSARSISGIHIRDVLDKIATQYPALLSKFGGHAMAAGLSIRKKDLNTFQKYFDEAVKHELGDVPMHAVIETDGELSGEDFTIPQAMLLQSAGPWGQHFPEPMFDGVFEIVNQRLVGNAHIKFQLKHALCAYPIDAIAFQIDTSVWPNHRAHRIELVYRLDINTYRDRASLQLLIEKMRPLY